MYPGQAYFYCSINQITSLSLNTFHVSNTQNSPPVPELCIPRVEVPQRIVDNDCPICLAHMDPVDNLVYCRYSCGKSLHIACFNEYTQHNVVIRCVYCRSLW